MLVTDREVVESVAHHLTEVAIGQPERGLRVVHFADVHLGVENYGRLDPSTGLSTRLADFLAAIHQIIDAAQQEHADLVLFAGDAYRTRDPSPTYQREFARRIRRLSLAGLPTVLLAGNHDVPNAVGRAHTLEIFGTLAVENVYVAHSPDVLAIETPHGPVSRLVCYPGLCAVGCFPAMSTRTETWTK